MSQSFIHLGDQCDIRAGVPSGRVKAGSDTISKEVPLLLPKAISQGCIQTKNLELTRVSDVKPIFFTRKGDIVIKLSTPYESVWIDEGDEGILVTSSFMILRKKKASQINMGYLALFLNSAYAKTELQRASSGNIVQLLKKPALEGLEIPAIRASEQKRLAALFKNVQQRNKCCREMVATGEMLLEQQLSKAITFF